MNLSQVKKQVESAKDVVKSATGHRPNVVVLGSEVKLRLLRAERNAYRRVLEDMTLYNGCFARMAREVLGKWKR